MAADQQEDRQACTARQFHTQMPLEEDGCLRNPLHRIHSRKKLRIGLAASALCMTSDEVEALGLSLPKAPSKTLPRFKHYKHLMPSSKKAWNRATVFGRCLANSFPEGYSSTAYLRPNAQHFPLAGREMIGVLRNSKPLGTTRYAQAPPGTCSVGSPPRCPPPTIRAQVMHCLKRYAHWAILKTAPGRSEPNRESIGWNLPRTVDHS